MSGEIVQEKENGQRKELRGLLILFALTVAAYLNSFAGVFQYDDYAVIVDYPPVHSFSTWLDSLPHGIRPLLKLSYLLNWITGGGATGFHLVNLSIHLLNVYFVFLLASLLCRERMARPAAAAFAAAGIFALHPLQTEAVTYICGRSASLSATFYLAGFLMYARSRRNGETNLLLPPLLFICALLVKETALTFPFALLLWEYCRQDRKSGESPVALRRQWTSWVVFFTGIALFLAHPRYGALLEYSFDIRDWGENVLNQVGSVTYLLSRLLVLNGMNIDPDLPGVAINDAKLLFQGGFLLVLAAIGVLSLRRLPWVGFGLLWFFLHLLPTNSFIPRLDPVNDRQAYLPLVGIAIAAGGTIASAAPDRIRTWLKVAAAALVVTLASFTALRNRDYRSEIALWEDASRKSPGKARVHNNLGYAYQLAGQMEKARSSYIAALRIDPSFRRARTNLAEVETVRARALAARYGTITAIPVGGAESSVRVEK